MVLLTLDQIADDLLERVNLKEMEDLGISPSETCLMPSHEDPGALARLEVMLGVPVDTTYSKIIMRYDFSSLQLAGVFFGGSLTYIDYLLEQNLDQDGFPWWGDGLRPAGYIQIASSDGYILLLKLESGEILSFARSDVFDSRQKIAANFELFLCGLGTVKLTNVEDQPSLEALVGSRENTAFWREVISLSKYRT